LTTKKISYNSQLIQGIGVDSSTEQAMGTAIKDKAPVSQGGKYTYYDIMLTKSQQDFQESLDISAAVSVNYPAAGGNAKLELSQQHAMTNTDISLVVKCSITGPNFLIQSPEFNDTAKQIYLSDSDSFKKTYGDYFVHGFETGAAYYGVCQIHTTSTEDQTNVSASLSVTVGLGLASLNTSITDAIKKSASNTSTTCWGYVEGPFQANAFDIDSMIKEVTDFPTNIKGPDDYVDLVADLMSYDTVLPGPPIQPIQNRDDIIAAISGYRARALSDRATIEFILVHPSTYPSQNVNQLKQDEGTLNTFLDTLQTRMTGCLADFNQCKWQDLVYPTIAPFPQSVDDGTIKNAIEDFAKKILFSFHGTLTIDGSTYSVEGSTCAPLLVSFESDKTTGKTKGDFVSWATATASGHWATNTLAVKTFITSEEDDYLIEFQKIENRIGMDTSINNQFIFTSPGGDSLTYKSTRVPKAGIKSQFDIIQCRSQLTYKKPTHFGVIVKKFSANDTTNNKQQG
jgi:hypothetical protein